MKSAFQNIILIAGAGRNVGKTKLACKIIRHLSQFRPIMALKISPHFHDTHKMEQIILNRPGLIISEENGINDKDSSRMKQAGAVRSFFVRAHDRELPILVKWLEQNFPDNLFVCESGGMRYYLKPALFLFVHKGEIPIDKRKYLEYKPDVTVYKNGKFNIKAESIAIKDNGFIKK